MGKFELEAKDETIGIFGRRRWHLDEEDWQTERAFWVVSLVFFSLVVLLAAA
jgi:hypothetical protein